MKNALLQAHGLAEFMIGRTGLHSVTTLVYCCDKQLKQHACMCKSPAAHVSTSAVHVTVSHSMGDTNCNTDEQVLCAARGVAVATVSCVGGVLQSLLTLSNI